MDIFFHLTCLLIVVSYPYLELLPNYETSPNFVTETPYSTIAEIVTRPPLIEAPSIEWTWRFSPTHKIFNSMP
jgi:hypothetical protein